MSDKQTPVGYQELPQRLKALPDGSYAPAVDVATRPTDEPYIRDEQLLGDILTELRTQTELLQIIVGRL